MPIKDHLKLALIAVGIPVAILSVVFWATPLPNQPKESFQTEEFVPKTIETRQGRERKGADYFELWLTSPSDKTFFFRNPESAPVELVWGRIPATQKLRLRFWPSHEGNVLLEIVRTDTEEVILSFDERMEAFASKQRLVSLVAGLWFLIFTGIWIALAKIDVKPSKPLADALDKS